MTSSEILDMVDEGILDARDALNAALQYLSTDDVADLAITNGWDEGFEDDDEEYEDEDEYEDDDDTYYDPIDGYKDTEGFHNSIEEAEDDYYENEYKVDIPEEE